MAEVNRVIEHVYACQSKLGEGPVWHPQEQVLYWLDILNGKLHRLEPHSGECEITELGLVVGSLGLRSQGGFVMATGQGFAFWDPEEKQFDFLEDPDPGVPGARFNDGKTDPQGRFWAGKMSDEPKNSLFRLDPDRSVHRMESGVSISNGLGWSPDQRVMYFTDSLARVIYAYDFDSLSGQISNRRTFAEIPDAPGEGIPDGLAIDEQGCVWSARWGGWKIVRYSPEGRVEEEITMPVEFPTSCAFGGPDLSHLYITSAWVEVRPENRAAQDMAGDLFRIQVGVRGLPEPFFRG